MAPPHDHQWCRQELLDSLGSRRLHTYLLSQKNDNLQFRPKEYKQDFWSKYASILFFLKICVVTLLYF